jgi:hypothetical protein
MRLQTRAFAVASGFLAAGAIFLLTLLLLAAGGGSAPRPVLQAVLFGYSVSVQGAFIGAMWSFAYGFLSGAIFAFVYNISVVPPAPPPFEEEALDVIGEED